MVVFRNGDGGYLLSLPRVVQQHVNLESTVLAVSEVYEELRVVTLLRSFERLHALCACIETAKAEIFETDDAAVQNAGEVH